MREPETTVRSQLRIPADIYERVKDAAEASGRSMNAEIIERLEKSFSAQRRALPADWTIRTQIASAREIYLSTVEMMSRAIDEAINSKKSGVKTLVLRSGETADLDTHIDDLRSALNHFRKQCESATQLLSEIALLEATGKPMSAEEMEIQALGLGIALPGLIATD